MSKINFEMHFNFILISETLPAKKHCILEQRNYSQGLRPSL